MGDIYFVRHAESDIKIHDEFSRPLTEKGIQDSALVANYLEDKNIQYIYSSPYVRAVDTVKGLSERLAIDVTCIDDFRERSISMWVEDFTTFSQRQWDNFDYRLSDGECLREVQSRNVKALMKLVQLHPEANCVIGSHGTALSTLINHFNPHFGFEDFSKIKGLMPWIVKMSFENQISIKIESIDVFKNNEITTIGLSEPMLTDQVK